MGQTPESESVASSVSEEPEPVRQVEPEPEPVVTQSEPEPERLALTMRFRDECWVEVSDARRRVLYGLKKPGAESNFRGEPPFKFFLGNAASVELEIDGKVFPIPVSRSRKTARFTIEEDDLE